MVMMSPFADSIRQQPMQASQVVTPNQGLGQLFRQLGMGNIVGGAINAQQNPQPYTRITRDLPQAVMTYDQAMSRNMQQDMKSPEEQARIDAAIAAGPTASRPAQILAQPANPFEGNEQYQALMEFQQSLAPNQEQQQRLQELQSAFEGTGAYKDYRINQLQNQLQQRQFNPMMGMGLGGMRPTGMQPYQGFGRPQFPMQQPMQQPMRQFGAMGFNQPQPYQQQQYGMMGGYGMSPYQQMRPQPQQFGGYGMGQQMGGYGGYGQMPNPYQPQQFGYNPNNFMGYGQQAQNQFQSYMR
jgi:hypothetical protein